VLQAGYVDDISHPAWSHDPLPEFGALLLPDARNVGQQELEWGPFDAMSDTVNELHRRPPASLVRPATILRYLTITEAGDLAVVQGRWPSG